MSFQSPSPSPVALLSTTTVYPKRQSTAGDLKLSASDLPMLSCHYIQKGCLYPLPDLSIPELAIVIRESLSIALTHFPPLAGRLSTHPSGHVYITCNDAGALFVHAEAASTYCSDVVSPFDVPPVVKKFFSCDHTVSFSGHHLPITVVQMTQLADGVFVGCTVNHAVTDGTSFWNFFNTLAELCRGVGSITRPPVITRNSALMSAEVLPLPAEGPQVTFDVYAPLRERIFSFSKESISMLKAVTNHRMWLSADQELSKVSADNIITMAMLENWLKTTVRKTERVSAERSEGDISSFQALCSLLWRGVTRARRLPSWKKTTMRMAVNCRPRLEPKLDTYYFGNAIQSIPSYATAGDVLSGGGLRRCAEELNRNVREHCDRRVRSVVEEWGRTPRCFPLGNFDGAMITVGSSPRFPMYDNDLGWGKPTAVRSGGANKFDGKVSAYPGREGGGSVDLEVCLSPETMARLETDDEFMQYVVDGAATAKG